MVGDVEAQLGVLGRWLEDECAVGLWPSFPNDAQANGTTLADADDAPVDWMEIVHDGIEAPDEPRLVEAADGRVDDLTVIDLSGHVELEGPLRRGRSIWAAGAVAAAAVLVIGAFAVTDGGRDGVVTEPVSSPFVTDAALTPTSDVGAVVERADPALPRRGGYAPVWTSVDGLTWSRVASDEAVFDRSGGDGMFDVIVGGPGLVAVGRTHSRSVDEDAAVWTSVDGLTWSRVPHDEAVFGGGLMYDVTVGGPGLVAVGESSFLHDDGTDDEMAAVWTSIDGLTWSRVPHDEAVFGGGFMSNVVVAGPGLVAVGAVNSEIGPDAGIGRDAAVWTSVDGITWSRVPHDEAVFGGPDNQYMMDVIIGGPGLVAVGTDGDGDWDHGFPLVAAVWTSGDGLTWSRVPHDDAAFGRMVDPDDDEGVALGMVSVAAGGPGLVAVGVAFEESGYSTPVWTSVDGLTWSRVPDDRGTRGWDSAFWVDVVAGGPGLVAVGTSIWTSVDGITWSQSSGPARGLGKFWSSSVVVGGPGLIAVGG